MGYSAIATDDFNRADSSLDATGNWIRLIPGQASTPSIGTNKVYGYNLGDPYYPCAVWSGSGSFSNDQYAKVAISGGANQDDSYRSGVLLRSITSIDASRSYYQCTVTIESTSGGSANHVHIDKYVTGTKTALATASSVTWTDGDILLGQVVGTTITVYRNSTQILQTTDSALSTGKPGLVAAGGNGSGFGLVDNWEGGNVTAGGLFRSLGGALSGLGSSGPFFQNPLQ